VWSHAIHGGFGSGGATVTSASSANRWGITVDHLTTGPKLFSVHRQRTHPGDRRQRPRTRKPAPGQVGLRRNARFRPALISTRFDHHVRAAGQPKPEHHRHLTPLEQHCDRTATQMIQTPGR
jgi:hypothetical protein